MKNKTVYVFKYLIFIYLNDWQIHRAIFIARNVTSRDGTSKSKGIIDGRYRYLNAEMRQSERARAKINFQRHDAFSSGIGAALIERFIFAAVSAVVRD